MDRNRIITMMSILKKENGSYIYKQNRASAFGSYLESLDKIYYSFHRRNQMLFEGLKDTSTDILVEEVKNSKKLHVIFIHEPMDVSKEEIFNTYISKKNIVKGEAVLIIDVLPSRRGELPKNEIIYAYWSARDVANEYSSFMSFIYHLITDMFSVVQLHNDSRIYDGDIIIDFKYGLFLNKSMVRTFRPELRKKYEWKGLRTILNDRFASIDSISSDPLANTGVFKACADDFFLLFRVTIVDVYTRFLREDSINTKNRIDTITERIRVAEFSLINDEADKELEDMNDIINTRLEEGGE